MSNLNRYEKSPNPKVARYLHRIQQLVGNRGRTPSPLSSRISKPIKPNSLDSFLKYELTFKILIRFFNKNNSDFQRHFFNNLRSTAQQTREKIYRFVSIQKSQCTHLQVDTTISTKMMINFLKKYLNNNKKHSFNVIKNQSTLSESVLMFNTPRSMITRREKISQKATVVMFHSLKTLLNNRNYHFFHKLELAPLLAPQQRTTRQQIPFIPLWNLEKIFRSKKLNQTFFAFGELKSHFFRNKIYQIQQQKAEKQIYQIAGIQSLKNKNKLLNDFKMLMMTLTLRKVVQKGKKTELQLNSLKKMKQAHQNIMVSTSTLLSLDNHVYQATINLNSALLSIILRNKVDVFRKIDKLSRTKLSCIQKLDSSSWKIENRSKSIGFQFIKMFSFKKEVGFNIQYARQVQFDAMTLNDIFSRLERKNLKISLDKIIQRQKDAERSRKIITRLVSDYRKINLRSSFSVLRNVQKHQSPVETELGHQMVRIQALPLLKSVQKQYIKQIMQSFLNIKNSRKVKTKNQNLQKNYPDWKKDMSIFLEQRNSFRDTLTQKVKKVDSILKEQQSANIFKDESPFILNSPRRKNSNNAQNF